ARKAPRPACQIRSMQPSGSTVVTDGLPSAGITLTQKHASARRSSAGGSPPLAVPRGPQLIGGGSHRSSVVRATDNRRSSGQRPRPPLDHLVGDDRALHLAGALPDPLHPQFAEEPLGHVLA